MDVVLISLACGAAGYLVGSIPFGYLIVRLVKGVDIRQYGSGRTGGTNVFRVAGFPAGVITAILDFSKGAAVVLMLRQLLPAMNGWPEALAGIGVVLGHNASCFLGFRGGAGGATSVGTTLALWPVAGIPGLVGGIFVLFVIGYASLASIVASLVMAIILTVSTLWSGNAPLAYTMYGWFVVFLVAVALRPNIVRLLHGTEKKVSLGKRDT